MISKCRSASYREIERGRERERESSVFVIQISWCLNSFIRQRGGVNDVSSGVTATANHGPNAITDSFSLDLSSEIVQWEILYDTHTDTDTHFITFSPFCRHPCLFFFLNEICKLKCCKMPTRTNKIIETKRNGATKNCEGGWTQYTAVDNINGWPIEIPMSSEFSYCVLCIYHLHQISIERLKASLVSSPIWLWIDFLQTHSS